MKYKFIASLLASICIININLCMEENTQQNMLQNNQEEILPSQQSPKPSFKKTESAETFKDLEQKEKNKELKKLLKKSNSENDLPTKPKSSEEKLELVEVVNSLQTACGRPAAVIFALMDKAEKSDSQHTDCP